MHMRLLTRFYGTLLGGCSITKSVGESLASIDGVSLTHGMPCQYIWSFASGLQESGQSGDNGCVCGHPALINAGRLPHQQLLVLTISVSLATLNHD